MFMSLFCGASLSLSLLSLTEQQKVGLHRLPQLMYELKDHCPMAFAQAPSQCRLLKPNKQLPVSMHMDCTSNSANLSNDYASLRMRTINKHFGHPATFWFGIFAMLFAPLGMLFIMKTLEDKQYVVIKAYKFTVLRCPCYPYI